MTTRLSDPIAEAERQEAARAALQTRANRPARTGFPAYRKPRAADCWPAGDEAGFQDAAERHLRAAGYMPRGPRYLADMTTAPVGYYLHLHQCERNPTVLDLLITDNATGLYCEIELKAACGAPSADQQALVDRQTWACIVWTWEQFTDAVRVFVRHCRETQQQEGTR